MDGQNSTGEIYFVLLGLSQYLWAQTVFFCLLLLSYVITLFGNCLILLLICCDPRLHMPMYFFLSNVSFLDVGYTTSSVPQILINCLVTVPAILLGQCLAQMAVGSIWVSWSVSCWPPWPMIAVWPSWTPCATPCVWGPGFAACWPGPRGQRRSC